MSKKCDKQKQVRLDADVARLLTAHIRQNPFPPTTIPKMTNQIIRDWSESIRINNLKP